MFIKKLTEPEIEMMENFYTPECMAESLFSDIDNLSMFEEDKYLHLRFGQFPLISNEYLHDNDPKLTAKQNMKRRENVGNLDCFASRNWGKTACERIDILLSLLCIDNEPMALSSYDLIHVRGVLNPIVNALEFHPFLNLYKLTSNKSPAYLINTKNGNVLDGINANIADGNNAGKQYYQKHFKKLWLEEGCVSGDTSVKCLDEQNNRTAIPIRTLINQKLWKKYKILSYNIDKQIFEYKKILKPFKKTVKNYTYFEIHAHSYSGNQRKRILKVSKKQELYTSQGWKNVTDLQIGDTLYTDEYKKLLSFQKEMIIGLLLGDASIVKKPTGVYFPAISMIHGKGQEDYLKYKVKCLENIFCSYRRGGKVNYQRLKTSFGGNTQSCTSDTNLDLIEFNNFKKDVINIELLKKYFSPISFAFWIMDDGNLHFGKGKRVICRNKFLNLHTEGFGKKNNELLRDFLEEKYNLIPEIVLQKRFGKEYYHLKFNATDTVKIVDMVKTYIYPTLYYKIFSNRELCEIIHKEIAIHFDDLQQYVRFLLEETKVLEVKPIKASKWTMFDVEVKDNHNFLASSILISNSEETEEVYTKRIDSKHALGCVERISGMTNFTRTSPAGRLCDDITRRKQRMNVPTYINPDWGENDKQEAIKKYNGEKSIGFRVYVKGEVIEDGISAIDMERVRKSCYPYTKKGELNTNKVIKSFEVDKKSFDRFKQILIIEKPSHAERVWINSDIGYTAKSEIMIFFEVAQKYLYSYAITLQNVTDKEQFEILKFIGETLSANFIALDCGDGTGKAIYGRLEEVFPKDNLIWYDGNMKIPVDFEKDTKGNVKFEKGKPLYRELCMAEWSVLHLKDLLYSGRVSLPIDYALDKQLSKVISMQSGNRVIYKCAETDDHKFDSLRVFSIAQWMHEFNLIKPINAKTLNDLHCKTGI